jgi:hypothetical protein
LIKQQSTGERMTLLYKDKSILITDEDITINCYYFPFGQSKVIPWDKIRTVHTEPLTALNGKYRVWGMGVKPYWFNSDWRANKNSMLVIDTGEFVKAAITPDNFDQARQAIESKVSVA